MGKRKEVSKTTRFEVFKRDGFICGYCGRHPPAVMLEADHIISVAEGGSNDESNLITSCADCNRGKGARPLEKAPASIAERTEILIEKEEQIRAYQELRQREETRITDEAVWVLDTLDPTERLAQRQANITSTKKFIRELGYHDVLEAAEIAYAQGPVNIYDRFPYFCGICWNRIREGAA